MSFPAKIEPESPVEDVFFTGFIISPQPLISQSAETCGYLNNILFNLSAPTPSLMLEYDPFANPHSFSNARPDKPNSLTTRSSRFLIDIIANFWVSIFGVDIFFIHLCAEFVSPSEGCDTVKERDAGLSGQISLLSPSSLHGHSPVLVAKQKTGCGSLFFAASTNTTSIQRAKIVKNW